MNFFRRDIEIKSEVDVLTLNSALDHPALREITAELEEAQKEHDDAKRAFDEAMATFQSSPNRENIIRYKKPTLQCQERMEEAELKLLHVRKQYTEGVEQVREKIAAVLREERKKLYLVTKSKFLAAEEAHEPWLELDNIEQRLLNRLQYPHSFTPFCKTNGDESRLSYWLKYQEKELGIE